MRILSRSALQQLNELMTASLRTSQCGEALTSPKMKTKPVTLCTHGGYKASFKACLLDLGWLEKHTIFNSAVGKQQKPSLHGVVNSHKASPSGLFLD